MSSFSLIKYQGITPGANGNTTVLFATVLPAAPTDVQNAQWMENAFALFGMRKFSLLLKCNQAGTLNAYESRNRGVTWSQIDSVAVAAPAATASFVADFVVESLRDWKLEWVNGGVAQNPWDVNMSMSDQRAAVT